MNCSVRSVPIAQHWCQASCDVRRAAAGERVDQVPPQEAGALGQVILVASRLGAYCRAAWYLLVAAGEAADGNASAPAPEAAAPFSRYCSVLKLLMRHSILQRVQVRRESAAACCTACAVVG